MKIPDMDWREPGNSFQVIGPTSQRKRPNVPAWMHDAEALRALLLKHFPKLESDPRHRAQAARWLRVIVLYRSGHSCSYIAEELGVARGTVRCTLQRIRWAQAGLSTKFGGPVGRRGRPRKNSNTIQTSSEAS